MKNSLAFLASFAISCCMAAPARADSILSVTGGPGTSIPVGGSQSSAAESQYVELSFVIGSSFHNVAITIPQMVFSNWAGTAWLTNAIGPGTISANVIATVIVDPFHGGQGVSTTTFISGVNLSPGTYYFTLSSPFCSGTDNSSGCGLGLWPIPSNPTIQAAPGAAFLGEGFVGGFLLPGNGNSPAANFQLPPASPFSPILGATPLAIAITGTPVPEPSSLILVGAGLFAMWIAKLGKRRAVHA